MADDLIQKYGEDNPSEKSLAEAELLAGLQGHFASGEVDSAAGLISDWGGIIASTATKIAEVAAKRGVGLPLHWAMDIAIDNQLVPVSITLDALGDDTWKEAFAKNIGGAVAGAIVDAVATGALGSLTTAGSGVIATAAATAGTVIGTVAVGYFAAEFVNDAIGVAWDHWIGPKVEGSWNQDDNSAEFTVFGRFSDALRNNWDGMAAQDANGDGISLNLDDLSGWTLTSAHPDEQPLEINFDRAGNTFLFQHTTGLNSLWDFYYGYGEEGTLIEWAFKPDYYGTTEGSGIVEEILRHHDGNFNVAVGDSGEHLVHNYYHLSRSEIRQSALAGDTAAIWAIESLSSFVEDGFYPEAAIDPDEYSDHYLEDRAAFLFHLLHPGEQSSTGEDIDFEDLELLQDAYAGNGEIDLPGNAKYLFGTEASDSLSGSSLTSRSDHLYGMDGDDTLTGNGGNDYLEGGKGQDIMDGGSGEDTFIIQGEDTAYDEFHGDTDSILGGDGFPYGMSEKNQSALV